jgi:aminopeptidase N
MVAARLALVDEQYASKLAKDFKQYKGIAPDMRSAVAIAYARTAKDFQGLVRAFRESESDEDKDRLLAAMSNLPDEALVQETLDFALSGEVKRQDAIFVIAAAARNPQAKNVTWNCIRSNLGKLQAMYQSTGLLSGVFLAIIPVLGVGRAKDVEEFFHAHPVPEADIGVKAGLERLRSYDRMVRRIVQLSATDPETAG